MQPTTERALAPVLAGSMEISRSKKQQVAAPPLPLLLSHIAKIEHPRRTHTSLYVYARERHGVPVAILR